MTEERIKNAAKFYLVITNYEEIAEKAKALGHKEVYLMKTKELTEEKLLDIRKQKKCALLMLYTVDGEDRTEPVRLQLNDWGIHVYSSGFFNKGASISGNSDKLKSLNDAVEKVASPEEALIFMELFGLVACDDYSNRCGNCQAYFSPGEKYCRKCGTPRGKGAFEPYYNVTNYVYGPQVKMKFKCPSCGHLWITAQMGGDDSNYCPECGKDRVTIVRRQVAEKMFGLFGCLEPFEEDKRPLLCSDEEIVHFLNIRSEDNKDLWANDILKLMQEEGYDFPKDEDETWERPLTEAEGEKLTLVDHILGLKGNEFVDDYHCPCCNSDKLAAIEYKTREIVDDTPIHIRTKRNNPLIKDGYSASRIRLEDGSVPALLCLSCGNEFGNVLYPEK